MSRNLTGILAASSNETGPLPSQAGTPGGMVPVRASKLKPRPLHELLPEGMDPLHPEAAEKIVEAQGAWTAGQGAGCRV